MGDKNHFGKENPLKGRLKADADANVDVEVSRNAYMKLDEIKNSNHPILDSSDVFCVQGD